LEKKGDPPDRNRGFGGPLFLRDRKDFAHVAHLCPGGKQRPELEIQRHIGLGSLKFGDSRLT